jgi:hypothetical protein
VLIFCIAGLLSLCFEHVHHWELNASRGRPAFSSHLVCSIKGKVKKKSLSRGWNFSTFAAHFIEQDLFWPAAPYARLLGAVAQEFWFSLPAVFIALFATKPVSSETSKAERWS